MIAHKITLDALRYGTRCQGISQFYLHIVGVLIYQPWVDGRLSRPTWLITHLDGLSARRR